MTQQAKIKAAAKDLDTAIQSITNIAADILSLGCKCNPYARLQAASAVAALEQVRQNVQWLVSCEEDMILPNQKWKGQVVSLNSNFQA